MILSSPGRQEGFFILLLECGKIKKSFGDRLVVDLESLRVYSEDRIGVVGANGAGKTTLLNILSQRLMPDEGRVTLYTTCAYVSQLEPPEKMRISPEMASKFGVATSWDEKMSGGEKTRFKLAASFEADCPLLFADEPTSNLDSLNEAIILKALAEDKKRTIVLVSHRASTMRIARRVYSVDGGRLS